MANPFIAVRITPDLDAAIAQRVKETGQSKSDVVIEALKTYLGILPQAHRLAEIEQRLSALEASAEISDEVSPNDEDFST
jgi:Arc/MetJ-type ribon-helix-helix transcriptional regulator